MIGLYLLAAHMVGDYLLQTRWQAAAKLRLDAAGFAARTRHVLAYCLPFVPIAVVYSPGAWHAAAFMALLYVLHFVTDSRRFRSTLGDVIAFRYCTRAGRSAIARNRERHLVGIAPDLPAMPAPNPWPPMPILLDQSLHLCQLAVLGGLFLR